MDKIKVLVISNEKWNDIYSIPDFLDIVYYLDDESLKDIFDITFIDGQIFRKDFEILRRITKAYTVFYTEQIRHDEKTNEFLKSRKASEIKRCDIQKFLDEDITCFFSIPYGEKYRSTNFEISPFFKGNVNWDGGYDIEISGEFGVDFQQIAYWKNTIPVLENQSIDFYFEYTKTGEVDIRIIIDQYKSGYVADKIGTLIIEEKELDGIFRLDNTNVKINAFVSICARGKGTIRIKALHDRYSRKTYGYFLPGGERYVSSLGEEVFAYFDPGDLKPPLNVYFSGYKTKEGFEGYWLMKSLGAPFLLIAEARLEGGAFYMGDDEYEQIYKDVIKSKLKELGFEQHQVILSGLSMGTTGALYYSCDIQPHAVILGKPLANVGNIAKEERRFRPGGFPTSLDVLKKHTGNMDYESIVQLNDRMWNKISKADFSHTIFALSYMIEDDYDKEAYDKLLANLTTAGVVLYGKGLHGRHNDNTSGVAGWFIERYKSILREDYKRDI